MKDCLIVRGVSIGAGRPKIIAPIMGRTMEELEMQARQIARARADVAEWRADAFEGAQNEDETRAALRLLRDALGEKPILYTVRTRAQGGEIEMSPDLYKSMTLCAARSGLAGSPTQVVRSFVPERSDTCEVLEGSVPQQAARIIALAEEAGL